MIAGNAWAYSCEASNCFFCMPAAFARDAAHA